MTQAQINQIVKEADIQTLIGVFNKLDNAARAEVLKAISKTVSSGTKTATMQTIRRLVAGTDADVKTWLTKTISESYVSALNFTDKEMKTKRISADVSSGKVTLQEIKTSEDLVIHAEAINALLSDSYLDFANSMNGMVRGVEKQLNEAAKRQIRAKNIAGTLSGDSIQEIKREIKSVIGDQGFSVLLDKGGHEWALSRYSEMLARTHVIKSSNEAVINRAGQFDVDIVEVSKHSGVQDDLCLSEEGKIYSISGKSKNHPKLDNPPPFHPNCRHTLLMRPELD